ELSLGDLEHQVIVGHAVPAHRVREALPEGATHAELGTRHVDRDVERRQSGLPNFYVSLNVSGMQLREAGKFQQHLAAAMRTHGVANADLMLEITERHLVQDVKGGLPVLESLVASGIRVSVDDFGTGYSNLETLKNLTVSQIKIDRTFVRNLVTEVGDRAIVKSIIALGRSLGLQVVAEGVETIEQRQMLQASGCDLLQGYLFARPLTAGKVPPFLDALEKREAGTQTGG
ncbi:MAG: EAL domain-containing protein, partial [Rhodanobacteraceae bacterium]